MDWNLASLIERYDTPFYVLNPSIATSRYEKLQKSFDWKVKFASKSNFDPQLLRAMNDVGASFVCGSAQEAKVCRSVGVPASRLQVTAISPSQSSVETLVKLSKEDSRFITTANSLSTIEQLDDGAYQGRVLLRIPADVADQSESKYASGSQMKFGMTEDERSEAIEIIENSDMSFYGIHSHLGGSFKNDDIDVFIRHIKRTISIAEQYAGKMKVINFGGGLGYGYKPLENSVFVQRLYDDIKPVLEPYEDTYEFVFEPGRFISAPSSVLVTEVRTVRERDGKQFVGVDAGLSEFPRPTMFDVYHHINRFVSSSEPENRDVIEQTVAGPTCSGADIFGTNRLFGRSEVGDILIINDVGAYGSVMANHFHAHKMPTVVNVDGTESPLLGDIVNV